jgi:hypothetical protein
MSPEENILSRLWSMSPPNFERTAQSFFNVVSSPFVVPLLQVAAGHGKRGWPWWVGPRPGVLAVCWIRDMVVESRSCHGKGQGQGCQRGTATMDRGAELLPWCGGEAWPLSGMEAESEGKASDADVSL